MARLIDLHVHSTFSDGTKTPSELVLYAKQKGVAAIAITDHDTVDGVQEGINKGCQEGIEVIPGVELSVEYDIEIHILGLGIDYKSPKLLSKLRYLKNERNIRNHKIIEKLNEIGVEITHEEARGYASEDVIGRPHIAMALINKGYAKNFHEVFEKYLGYGKVAYVKRGLLPADKSIQMIKDAGGIPILAHPGLMKKPPQETEKVIIELMKMGLEGIEVYHSDHNQETTKLLQTLAKKHNLLISGGSDYHGENKDVIDLGVGCGNLRIEYKVLENLGLK